MTAFLHISNGWDIPVVVNTGDKVEVYNRLNSEDPIFVRSSRSCLHKNSTVRYRIADFG